MRANYRAPERMHRADHKEIDRVMTIERGYIAQSVMMTAAVAVHNRKGFGASRIEQFAGMAYPHIQRYLDAPADKWPDMVREDCRIMRVEVDEELLAARGRDNPAITATHPVRAVTPQQAEALDRIAATMFSGGEQFRGVTKLLPAGTQTIFMKKHFVDPNKMPGRLKMPGLRDVKYAKAKTGVERTIIVSCMITACARALYDGFGFRRGQLLDFAEDVASAVCSYFDIEMDMWPDLAEQDVARIGVKIKDGWIVGKGRGDNLYMDAPELTAVQREYIRQSRAELPSDEESRIKHRDWINNPQRR